MNPCPGCGAHWQRKSGARVETSPGQWKQEPDFLVMFHSPRCAVEKRELEERAAEDARTPCGHCGTLGIVWSAWGKLCPTCTDTASAKEPHGPGRQ